MRFNFVIIFYVIAVASYAQNNPFATLKQGNLFALLPEQTHEHDISASASTNHGIIVASDGGKNKTSRFYQIHNKTLSTNAVLLKNTPVIADVEGGMSNGTHQYFVSSLSNKSVTTCQLVIFKQGEYEQCIALKAALVAALANTYTADWFNRISYLPAKKGGLNIEALAQHFDQSNGIAIGLRSPLWHRNFAKSKSTLAQGKALLMFLPSIKAKATDITIHTLNLKGHGIRALAYFPSLNSYILVGGFVEKKSHFSLWQYQPTTQKLTAITLQGFNNLCRPESILPLASKRQFYIIGEQSGEACETQKYDYLLAGY